MSFETIDLLFHLLQHKTKAHALPEEGKPTSSCQTTELCTREKNNSQKGTGLFLASKDGLFPDIYLTLQNFCCLHVYKYQ